MVRALKKMTGWHLESVKARRAMLAQIKGPNIPAPCSTKWPTGYSHNQGTEEEALPHKHLAFRFMAFLDTDILWIISSNWPLFNGFAVFSSVLFAILTVQMTLQQSHSVNVTPVFGFALFSLA